MSQFLAKKEKKSKKENGVRVFGLSPFFFLYLSFFFFYFFFLSLHRFRPISIISFHFHGVEGMNHSYVRRQIKIYTFWYEMVIDKYIPSIIVINTEPTTTPLSISLSPPVSPSIVLSYFLSKCV